MNSGDIATIDREIHGLESKLAELHKRRVTILQEELRKSQSRAAELSSGAISVAATTTTTRTPRAKAAKPGRPGRKRRKRMGSDEVRSRLIEAVKTAGPEGISLKDASDKSGVNYQTAAKVLKEMSDVFGKKGELKEARYFFKG